MTTDKTTTRCAVYATGWHRLAPDPRPQAARVRASLPSAGVRVRPHAVRHPGRAAMTPYYSDDAVTIWHADCRDVLPTLEPVDLVLTDPPYGLAFKDAEWDAEIPDWLPLAQALAKTVAFTTAPTTMWDYPRPDWVACWYRPAAQSRTSFGGFNHWTPVLIYGECHLKVDVRNLHAMSVAQPSGYAHPSPRPVELMRWLLEGLDGATVLDPFMGSGTTLRAAKDLGRKAIGIEIEERYCEIAAKRMSQTVMAL